MRYLILPARAFIIVICFIVILHLWTWQIAFLSQCALFVASSLLVRIGRERNSAKSVRAPKVGKMDDDSAYSTRAF